ncbi:MAG: polyprenyl diphosphate synthase [Qingshengfaniella sp.]
MAAKDTKSVTPRHVAIIMDGNGRWATGRGLPRLAGHRMGARRVKEIVRACPGLGVQCLTLFAFSTENWKRSRQEVTGLMALFRLYIRAERRELRSAGVRVRFIGDRGGLNPKLARLMTELEEETAGNDRLDLTVALNYGSRDELTRAACRLAADIQSGRLVADAVGADDLAARLDTAALPDPDLVIRTSGETRISNFLLWQSAYAEYEFTPVFWPDFSPDKFGEILMAFGDRERRFGAVGP